MSRIPLVLAVAVLVGLSLSVATAQTAEPEDEPSPPPSTEMNVLFAHGTGENEFIGFMNTLDEDGEDTSMGSGQYVNNAKTWTFHLEPNVTTGLLLDEEGTIDAYAYMGSTTNAGRLSVTTQVSSGDDVLAKGASKTLQFTAGFTLLTWEMEILNTTIHPDTNLTWTIRASGVATGASLGTGDTRKSNITLPIIGEAGGNGSEISTTYADVSTVNINETLEFENTTDARYQYNWTLEGENGASGELVVDGVGNVSLTAVDGNGTEVLNVNSTAGDEGNSSAGGGNSTSGNGTRNSTSIPLDAPDAMAGFWMVNVTVSNFTGTILLSLGPAVEPVMGPDPNATTNATTRPPRTSAASTTSITNETAEGRGVPTVGPVVAATVIALAALAARRRRT